MPFIDKGGDKGGRICPSPSNAPPIFTVMSSTMGEPRGASVLLLLARMLEAVDRRKGWAASKGGPFKRDLSNDLTAFVITIEPAAGTQDAKKTRYPNGLYLLPHYLGCLLALPNVVPLSPPF
jgi:hypothetical protein